MSAMRAATRKVRPLLRVLHGPEETLSVGLHVCRRAEAPGEPTVLASSSALALSAGVGHASPLHLSHHISSNSSEFFLPSLLSREAGRISATAGPGNSQYISPARRIDAASISQGHELHSTSLRGSPEENDADLIVTRAGPLAEYQHRVAEGTLHKGDTHQEEAVSLLQELYEAIIGVGGDNPFRVAKTGFWSRLMPRQRQSYLRGLYMFGGVGCGKTMLMDLFYNELPSWLPKKRTHFHDFMLSIHSKLLKYSGLSDPLERVAEEQAGESSILCLDEFMVTDVADAMILNRLFTSLFEHGVVLVATSNRPPKNLYENGLQRDLFVPFIAVMEERCMVHQLDSPTDYRKLTKIQQGKYFIGPDADDLLEEKVKLLTGGEPLVRHSVDVVMGRKLEVPRSANGIAYFHFQELCENPLGAADYFALCKNFDTVAVDGVPIFGAAKRSGAYRFVTFIDVIYESKAGLIVAAEGPPFELFEKVVTVANAPKSRNSRRGVKADEADILVDDELGFAKDRTVSRLIEMQSSEYERTHAAAHHVHHPPK